MQEIVYWQSTYKIHKGKGITDIGANNKNETMIIMTSDVSSYSKSPIVINNINNDNYIRTITIKFTITV